MSKPAPEKTGASPASANGEAQAKTAAELAVTAATKEAASSGGGHMLTPHAYSVTLPPPDDFFFVREDDLKTLRDGGKDHALEIALAAGGGALGLLQNLLHVIGAAYNKQPIENLDLVLAAGFLILVVIAGIKGIEKHNSDTSIDDIVNKIKSGQKVTVDERR
jgi:hypothetical protein